MAKTKIVTNVAEISRLIDELGDNLAPEMARTITGMVRGVKIAVGKHVAKMTGIKMSSLPKKYAQWHLHAATPYHLRATHIVTSERIPMEYFSPSPGGKMGGKTKGGVKVNLFGTTVSLKHSFMGQIYAKKGTGEKPLKVWARASTLSKKFRKKNKWRYESAKARGFNSTLDMAVKDAKDWDNENLRLKGRFPVSSRTFMSIAQMAEQEPVKEYINNSAEVRFIREWDKSLGRLLKEHG